jgi:hypothetical protein
MEHSLALSRVIADYKKQCREARDRRRGESEQIKKLRRMIRAKNVDAAAISRELGMEESEVRSYLRKVGFL